MPPDSPVDLIGRAQECAVVDDLLAQAARGNAGSLLVLGEPGVGKTALLRRTHTRAAEWTVLSCSAVGLERDVPFAGLQQLMHPIRRRFERLLSEEQAATLRAALELGPASFGGRLGVAAACLELVAALASDEPLLISVDDMHWLDTSTAEALDVVGRRLRAERVAMVVTTRQAPGPMAPWHGAQRLTLTGLPQSEARNLLARLGFNGSASQLDLLAESTGGNPLALSQAVADPSRIPQLVAGAPASIGPTLEAVYAQRIAELGPETSAALLVLAAADRERSDVIQLACRNLGHDPDRLVTPEATGLIVRDRTTLQFAHPLARAAHYNVASPADRRRAHRELAEAIAATDSGSGQRELQHRVLAAESPDEELAAQLERAAINAATRCAFGTAVDLLLQAADLSPQATVGHRRRLLAARTCLPAGRLREAARLAAAVPADCDDLHGDVVHLQARLAIWTGHPREAIDALATLARSELSPEPALLLAEASLAALMVGEQREGSALADEAVAAVQSADELAPAYLMQAFALANVNRLTEAQDRLDRALPLLGKRPGEQWPLIVGVVLSGLRQLDRAADVLDAAISAARAVSAVETLAIPLGVEAQVEIQRGHWAKAAMLAVEGLGAAEALGGEFAGIRANTCQVALAHIDALRGNAQACIERTQTILSAADIAAEPMAAHHAHRVLGLLALGSGDALRAAAHFGRVHDYCRSVGFEETPFLPYLADLIEARSSAESYRGQEQEPLTELHVTAEKTSTARDRGLYHRCLALTTQDSDQRLESAVQAVGYLDEAGNPFEAARARLLVGETLRRSKQRVEATSWLAEAATTFGTLQATPWLKRAENELRASGTLLPARVADQLTMRRSHQALTAQEEQVATLATNGLTNAEIAARLFLSSKTIEYHLGNTYRKLGIRRRSELTSALASSPG